MSIEKLDFETIEHEKVPFTLVHTKVIQKITDHFAGFIWVYLQSLPSNWKVNKTHLQNHFGIGEDKLKNHLAYLHRSKLIEYHRRRNPNGTLGKITIRVLNGMEFNNNPGNKNNIKTICTIDTTGVKSHPVVDHTSGFYPPYTNTIENLTNNNEELIDLDLVQKLKIGEKPGKREKEKKSCTCNQNPVISELRKQTQVDDKMINPDFEYPETYYPVQKSDTSTSPSQKLTSCQDKTFEEFWNLYPVKKNKLRCKAAWESQGCHEMAAAIITKLKEQIASDKQFLEGFACNPDRYVLQEKWNDEIQVKTKQRHYDHTDRSWALKPRPEDDIFGYFQ